MGNLLSPFTLFLVIWASLATNAHANVQHLEEAEFRALAESLAPKVNLFADTWKKDPHAVFYGGTTRDYLYWIKGKFLEANTREDALKVRDELLKLPFIDVRDFIVGDSDVDIVSDQNLPLRPEDYGVRKIDSISSDVFAPGTELGQSEISQGHVPVEKIQLRKSGLSQIPSLGDGAHEIYTGKLTVSFADPKEFAETKYALEGSNHPVLLALRYLRLQGINYFRTHGAGLPDRLKLFEAFDEKSSAQVRKVIQSTLDGEELKPFLENNRFRSWINGTIQKSFRSYTNPTAALEILKYFKVDELPKVYSGSVDPINSYVFQKHRDPAAIEAALKEYGVEPKQFYRPREELFSDGNLYHGTGREDAFRSILFQGVLPSEGGSAGAGLYGVATQDRKFAEKYRGHPELLVQFEVKPEAKIVDITEGEGMRVLEKFGGDLDEFADTFGIDIIRYPYSPKAFVVKNSAALGRAKGYHRPLMTKSELLRKAKTWKNPDDLLSALAINQVSRAEAEEILKLSPIPHAEMVPSFERLLDKTENPERLVSLLEKTEFWQKNRQRLAPRMLALKNDKAFARALRSVGEGNLHLDEPLMKALKEAIMEHPARIWDLFTAVAAHDKWPRLAETINILPPGNPVAARAFAMVLKARSGDAVKLSPAVLAMASEKVDPQVEKQYYLDYFFHRPRREMVDELNEITKGRIVSQWSEPYGSEYLYTILRKWKKYPKILDPFVENATEKQARKLLLPALIEFRGWVAHEDQLTRTILKAYPELSPELLPKGWSKSGADLQELLRLAPKGSEKQFSRLVVGLLMQDNLWEKNVELFLSLPLQAEDANKLLGHRRLSDYPGLMKKLLGVAHSHSLGNALSESRWLKYPTLISDLIKLDVTDSTGSNTRDAAMRALASPQWRSHPELIEELVANWPFISSKESNEARDSAERHLKNLLNEPHWRGHPAFAELLEDGALTYRSLRNRVISRTPEYRTMGESFVAGCKHYFRRLTGN